MSSGSGSGADQHLLALLRAIRLRQAAPDAVAVGIDDTVEALREQEQAALPALPPGEAHEALPPGAARPGLSADSVDESAAGQPMRPQWASPAPNRPAPGIPAGLSAGPADSSAGPADSSAGPPAGPSAGPAAERGPIDPAPDGAGSTGVSAFVEPADGPVPGRSFWSHSPVRPVPVSAKREPAPTEPETADASAAQPGAFGKALTTPEEAGRFADVEAVGKPSRNQFAGLPNRRPDGTVRPSAEPHGPGRKARLRAGPEPHQPHWLDGPEIETGPRPEWASGGAARSEHVQDEGDFLRGEGQQDGSAHATRPAGAPAPRLPGFDLPHVMPPMVARGSGAAGDGMDPADDALLKETQLLLSTSLTFAGGSAEVAERLLVALLLASPEMVAALPGGPRTRTRQLARALTWLVHHLDRPPVLVEGTGRLGAALAACGVETKQLHLVGAALAEALRAGMAPGQWRQDFDLAWRSTWQHVYEWMAHGAARAAYDPPVWDATVVEHDLRRPDLAVVRLQPTLPMPFRPGQFARVQVPELPAIWRPYSLAGAPRRDDLVELHVRAKTTTGVSATLVHHTRVGDHVRLSRAEGTMTLPATSGRDLLMIAGDTGVAPLKALLTELADTGDPRSAVLFWGVRDLSELYDIDEIAALARTARRATVVPVVSEGDPGPYASGLVTDAVAAYGEWSDHEVYLAGPPLMLAATTTALLQLGVSPDQIHYDAPE